MAKSTLSLWLRDVGLSVPQKKRITKKSLAAARRGGEVKRQQRIVRTERIHTAARKEIGKISKRELWLIGTALYWAEGAKQKEWSHSVGLDFGNTDARMIKIYLRWLLEICKVDRNDIEFRIYIHENNKFRIMDVMNHWLDTTGFSQESFAKTCYKKHNPKTVRKNVGKNYFGVLAVKVKRSIDLNRKITGWVMGIDDYFK